MDVVLEYGRYIGMDSWVFTVVAKSTLQLWYKEFNVLY